MNAVKYKEIFPLIQKGKVWLGHSIKRGGVNFRVPYSYHIHGTSCVGKRDYKSIATSSIRWFTNLDHKIPNEKMHFTKSYTPEEYPKYDFIDAINVDKTKDIPGDYMGVMGVPITFLDRYNTNQFELVGNVVPLD